MRISKRVRVSKITIIMILKRVRVREKKPIITSRYFAELNISHL